MKNVTKTNALFAFIVVFYLLCSYLISALRSYGVVIPDKVLQFLPQIIMLVPCVAYILCMRPETVKDISYAPVSVGTILKVIVMVYLLQPMLMFINGLSSMFVDNKVVDTLEGISEYSLWFKIATMALLPAIVEEFVFRGLIFHGLKKKNPLWAIIISALLFGALHMNVNQFLYAFAMGVFFAMIAYATGSMWPSMIMHFWYNAQSVILSHLIMKYASDVFESTEVVTLNSDVNTAALINAYIIVYGGLFVAAVIGVVLAMLLYFNICKHNRGDENVKRIFRKPFRNTFDESQGKYFDGYIMLSVGLCIVHMILNEIG